MTTILLLGTVVILVPPFVMGMIVLIDEARDRKQ